MKRKRVSVEVEQAKYYLAKARVAFVAHMLTVHKGVPEPTCHTCITFRQEILSNERFIRVVEGHEKLLSPQSKIPPSIC